MGNKPPVIRRMTCLAVAAGIAAPVAVIDAKATSDEEGISYSVAELQRIHPKLPCFARDLNEAGTAVGYCKGEDHMDLGVRWMNGQVEKLHPPRAVASSIVSINSRGEMTGSADGPVRWSPTGEVSVLKSLRGDRSGTAYAINEDGSVVGYSITDSGESHATRWVRNAPRDLAQDGGADSRAMATATAAGAGVGRVAVGTRFVGKYPYDHWRATSWSQGIMTDLPNLRGQPDCYAQGVSPKGLVIGYCFDATTWPFGRVAVEWKDREVFALGGKHAGSSEARGVNAKDMVVGYRLAESGDAYGVLWHNGREHNLNDMLSPEDRAAGWVISTTDAINDDGVIVGSGTCPGEREMCALILQPVSLR